MNRVPWKNNVSKDIIEEEMVDEIMCWYIVENLMLV